MSTPVPIGFELIACVDCGLPYMMTTQFHRKRLLDHKRFYCPAGHARHFIGKSVTERALECAERLERDLRGCRARVTRLQRELDKKPCPHCGKKLTKLSVHIRRKHPEKYVPKKRGK